jgi:hypothetical protein
VAHDVGRRGGRPVLWTLPTALLSGAGAAAGIATKQEAYRLLTIREGDKVVGMPALQEVVRSQFASVVKGSVAPGHEKFTRYQHRRFC